MISLFALTRGCSCITCSLCTTAQFQSHARQFWEHSLRERLFKTPCSPGVKKNFSLFVLKCFKVLMKGTQEGGLQTSVSLELITLYSELRLIRSYSVSGYEHVLQLSGLDPMNPCLTHLNTACFLIAFDSNVAEVNWLGWPAGSTTSIKNWIY